MDLEDGKKGRRSCRPERSSMKSLEKAVADYEKAKEKMEASRTRYEADLKRFKAAEAAKTEAENLEIVRIIRGMDMTIPELNAFRERMKTELPTLAGFQKEETRADDEFRENVNLLNANSDMFAEKYDITKRLVYYINNGEYQEY